VTDGFGPLPIPVWKRGSRATRTTYYSMAPIEPLQNASSNGVELRGLEILTPTLPG